MHRIVFITAPDMEVGRGLARAILEGRLAACVNLVPGVESHYWWEGELCAEGEVLLVVKTVAARLEELEGLVAEKHPYDTPEFVVMGIEGGSKRYLKWLEESCAG